MPILKEEMQICASKHFLNICNSLKITPNDLLFEKEPCEYDEGNIKDRIEMCSQKESNFKFA